MGGARAESVDGRAPGGAGRAWFFGVVLVLMAGVYVGGEVSNALTYLHPLQKDGNHFDESELTLAIRDGEPAAAFVARRHWGAQLVYAGYALHGLFGAETYGRRFVSLGMVLVGLAWLVWVLRRHGLMGVEGAALFVFLWGLAGALTPYTTFGLVPYPFRVLSAACLVHVVLAGYRVSFSRGGLAGVAVLLAAIVYGDVSCLVAVCALGGAVAVGDALRGGFTVRAMAQAGLRLGAILLPPVALALYLIVSNPHPELVNPNRNLDLYFPTSDFSKDVFGLAAYTVENSVRLIRGSLSLHPVIAGPFGGSIGGYVLGVFFLVGIVAALARPGGRSFPLAVYLLLGFLGHLLLSLVRLVPYGDLRYFLTFFPLFPFFAAFGVVSVAGWMGRWLPARPARLAVAGVLIALVCGQAWGVARLVRENASAQRTMREGFQRLAGPDAPGAVIVDDWTACTGRDEYPELLARPHYELATNLRTMWRGDAPGKHDNAAKWGAFLEGHDRIFLVTSLPFEERYYGALFHQAASAFGLSERTQARRWYFAVLERLDVGLSAPAPEPGSPWQRVGGSVVGVPGAGEVQCLTGPGNWDGVVYGGAPEEAPVLPCVPDTAYVVRVQLKGVRGYEGVKVHVAVYDQDGQRLAAPSYPLGGDYAQRVVSFKTGPGSRHLSVQLVKAKSPRQIVFAAKDLAVQPVLP
ncbi:MAG: hypothetical protein HYV27_01205 [Candidatus Hydrogenedentes bacterium]|nr:hypothetical protein [Candidatus Hydrogenedentota bacterium]